MSRKYIACSLLSLPLKKGIVLLTKFWSHEKQTNHLNRPGL